jgi:hypothetical protein
MKKPLLAAVAAVLWVLVGIMVWSFFDRVQSAATMLPAPSIVQNRIANQETRIQVTANIFVQSPANDIDASVKAPQDGFMEMRLTGTVAGSLPRSHAGRGFLLGPGLHPQSPAYHPCASGQALARLP